MYLSLWRRKTSLMELNFDYRLCHVLEKLASGKSYRNIQSLQRHLVKVDQLILRFPQFWLI